MLAKAMREVEVAVQRGRVRASTLTTFQVVALLVREERNRVKTADLTEARRTAEMKRIDGLATTMARTAARDGSLLALLADDAELLPGARTLMREMQFATSIVARSTDKAAIARVLAEVAEVMRAKGAAPEMGSPA